MSRKAVNDKRLDICYLVTDINVVNISIALYIAFAISLIHFFNINKILSIFCSAVVFLIILVWLISKRKRLFVNSSNVNKLTEHQLKAIRNISIPLVIIISGPLVYRGSFAHAAISISLLMLAIVFEYGIFSCYACYLTEKNRMVN